MAENKKSFILYCDLSATVSKLPDDVAGKLFKTILSYVNDENPEPEDILLQVAFEPIKQQLKRDLKDWEDKKKFRKDSGKKGGVSSGESRKSKQKEAKQILLQKTKQDEAKGSSASKIEANEADNVTVTVNGTVNVNGSVIQPPAISENQKQVQDYFLGAGGTIEQANKFYRHYEGTKGFENLHDWLQLAQNWYFDDKARAEKQAEKEKATW